MPATGSQKQFCPANHDTFLVGRNENGSCKPCMAVSRRKWAKNNPEAFQRYRYKADLKMKYGLTIEQHQAMIKEQGGKCKMCNKTKRLVIDHCHVSGKVRGLLCNGCNVAVGHYENHKPLIEKYLGGIR